MTTAVVLIESGIKVKDNNSKRYIKMGREVNTGEFTTEKQRLMRAECHMEQLMLVMSRRYKNIHPGLPDAVIHHKGPKKKKKEHKKPHEFHETIPYEI